jgi:hypothetical protein
MANPVFAQIRNFHILFILLGAAVLAAVIFIGNSISSTTSALVEVDLPLQNNILNLRSAIFAQKPILYEYYADTNRENFQKRFNAAKKIIKDGLYQIPRDDQGQSFLTPLEVQTAQIEQLAGQLDQTLSSGSVDWDKAREILVEVSAAEQQITPLIENFVSLNHKHIADTGSQAKTRMLMIFGLVAGFMLIILTAALLLGRNVKNSL